jgi:hypothetical protein
MLRIFRSLGHCRRLGSALLGIWFIALTMNLVSAHDCPMHDMAPVTADAAAAAPSDAPGNAHAMHGGHAHEADAGQAPASPGEHDAGHGCSCISHCCTAAAPLHAAESTVSFATIVAKSATPPGRSQQEFMAAWVDFVLPFSTAPPAGAVA